MWYDIIDIFLLTFGFKKSVANTNLYILKQDTIGEIGLICR